MRNEMVKIMGNENSKDGIGQDTAMTGASGAVAAALLDGLIDYAGLFPPADLSLEAMVDHYASYLKCEQSWVLGRVLVPVGMLEAFASLAPLPRDQGDDPWCVNALVSPSGDAQLSNDLDVISAFNHKHSDPANGHCLVDAVDLKASDALSIDTALDLMPDELMPFFELPVNSDIRGHVAALSGSVAGAKVRTGGIVPEAYPSPEAVSEFLLACIRADVPFKATAGLHHALCSRNEQVGADEFGFLNVFLGAALARACRLDHEELAEVLQERSSEAFVFEETSISWRNHEIGIEEIVQSRIEGAISYGSCAFDEPLNDLRHLGLII